jgi:hypothetical protein
MCKTNNKRGFWAVCKCLACGKTEHYVLANSLKSGHTKTCRCGARYKPIMKIGDRFGYLEVIDLIKDFDGKKYKFYSICYCHNCGNKNFKVIRASIKNGSTTSCGCKRDQYLKITGKNNSKFTGYEDISGKRWNRLKNGAKKRNLKFQITIKYIWNLYEYQNKKCALTGIPIFFDKNDHISTASLDRIDSKIGYIKGNVQWVHKLINKMKTNYELEKFLTLCTMVALNNK